MADWNKTQRLRARLALEDKIIYKEERPYYLASYQGRTIQLPIICRDSPILGGVCLGEHRREAFYVSPQSVALKDLTTEVKKRAVAHGGVERNHLLMGIFDTVTEHLPYDKTKTREVILKQIKTKDDLISLGDFIREHAGVCRHQAVACAALMELLGEDQELKSIDAHLKGKPSVDRNRYNGQGHTWARYTSPTGLVVILDVANNFIGHLNSEETQKKIKKGTLWPYQRPAEVIFPF